MERRISDYKSSAWLCSLSVVENHVLFPRPFVSCSLAPHFKRKEINSRDVSAWFHGISRKGRSRGNKSCFRSALSTLNGFLLGHKWVRKTMTLSLISPLTEEQKASGSSKTNLGSDTPQLPLIFINFALFSRKKQSAMSAFDNKNTCLTGAERQLPNFRLFIVFVESKVDAKWKFLSRGGISFRKKLMKLKCCYPRTSWQQYDREKTRIELSFSGYATSMASNSRLGLGWLADGKMLERKLGQLEARNWLFSWWRWSGNETIGFYQIFPLS